MKKYYHNMKNISNYKNFGLSIPNRRVGGGVIKMDKFISERIINIEELEAHIRSAYSDTCRLRSELEKSGNCPDGIMEYVKDIQLSLLKAKDFKFYLEQREVIESSRQHGD